MFIVETLKNIILVWLSLFLLVHNVNFFLAVILATIIMNLGSMILFDLIAVITTCFVKLGEIFKKDWGKVYDRRTK